MSTIVIEKRRKFTTHFKSSEGLTATAVREGVAGVAGKARFFVFDKEWTLSQVEAAANLLNKIVSDYYAGEQ